MRYRHRFFNVKLWCEFATTRVMEVFFYATEVFRLQYIVDFNLCAVEIVVESSHRVSADKFDILELNQYDQCFRRSHVREIGRRVSADTGTAQDGTLPLRS